MIIIMTGVGRSRKHCPSYLQAAASGSNLIKASISVDKRRLHDHCLQWSSKDCVPICGSFIFPDDNKVHCRALVMEDPVPRQDETTHPPIKTGETRSLLLLCVTYFFLGCGAALPALLLPHERVLVTGSEGSGA
ncbi:hypothetical protein JTE90_020683 [Oedothorax gibbosus]|uniref:Uncharacterized protein n=1 Tax=Oedothorax gibbosus TaxID=931172 RepID=A0AAV6V3Z2_9ARAC|nr:hypothetical protein JTE90_020683 [Oedothorax gibbosus]